MIIGNVFEFGLIGSIPPGARPGMMMGWGIFLVGLIFIVPTGLLLFGIGVIKSQRIATVESGFAADYRSDLTARDLHRHSTDGVARRHCRRVGTGHDHFFPWSRLGVVGVRSLARHAGKTGPALDVGPKIFPPRGRVSPSHRRRKYGV